MSTKKLIYRPDNGPGLYQEMSFDEYNNNCAKPINERPPLHLAAFNGQTLNVKELNEPEWDWVSPVLNDTERVMPIS
jgi:hypothetical protein